MAFIPAMIGGLFEGAEVAEVAALGAEESSIFSSSLLTPTNIVTGAVGGDMLIHGMKGENPIGGLLGDVFGGTDNLLLYGVGGLVAYKVISDM